jgi:hypothetical protein
MPETAVACPACGQACKGGVAVCPQCGSDLSLLFESGASPDRWYAEALELARRPDGAAEAIRKLEAALSLDPGHVEALIVLGKLRAQLGEYENAIAQWERALQLAPAEGSARDRAVRGIAKARLLLDSRKAEEVRAARHRRVALAASASAVFLLGSLCAAIPGWLLHRRDRAESAASLRAARSQAEAEALQRALAALPAALGDHVRAGRGQDLMAALGTASLRVTPAGSGGLAAAGTIPVAELRPVIETIGAAVAAPGRLDAGAVRVADEYIEYVIRPGDCPETIARRLCGTRRRLDELRRFSAENAEALDRMQIGGVLKIPKRLLRQESPGGLGQ